MLRGSGKVLSFVGQTGDVIEERSVCQAPRGIAFDAANDALVVACLEGTLVELPAAGGAAFRTTRVATDLRDVVFLGTTLVATRFRSAEILYLDAARNIVSTRKPLDTAPVHAATTAWRAVPTPDGSLIMTHQRALKSTIDIGDPGSGGAGGTGPTPAGGVGGASGPSSGYGNAFDPCGSIVQGAMSTATPDGTVVAARSMPGVALPVDVAVSPTGFIAVANGSFNPEALVAPTGMGLTVFPALEPMDAVADCGMPEVFSDATFTVTAVAFDSSGTLLAQTRNPSQVLVYSPGWDFEVIPLGGIDMADTGHEIFHTDTGSGVACASCHAEGTDDGHAWNFSGLGLRRTQPLDVGLEGTAPFHWDGDFSAFSELVHEVFQRRMGGPVESEGRIVALERYVYGLKRRPAVRAWDDPAALRGKALFESTEVGCATCHTGPKLTNGETEDIGKGTPLQVPSLIGVSTRPPYMHDACAATLFGRFDPICGGTTHGHVEHLDSAGMDDLVAYLESL